MERAPASSLCCWFVFQRGKLLRGYIVEDDSWALFVRAFSFFPGFLSLPECLFVNKSTHDR